jgi:hypothetical protein
MMGLIIGVIVGLFLLQEMLLSRAGALVAGGIPLGMGIVVAAFFYRRMFPEVQPFISRVVSSRIEESRLAGAIDPLCKMQDELRGQTSIPSCFCPSDDSRGC